MIRLVKMTFEEAYVEDFKYLFETIKNKIAACEGCNHLRLLQDEALPEIFFTYSMWESQQDLDAYRYSDLFKTTWTKIKPWFADKPEAWSVQEINSI